MSSSDSSTYSGVEILPIGPIKGGPLSPYEKQVAKEVLRSAMADGSITQQDIDTLKKSTRTIAVASSLGGLAAVPVYLTLRKRQYSPARALGGGLAMLIAGSFCGFVGGGLAVTMSINKNIANAHDKLRELQDIGATARDTILILRQTGTLPPEYTPPSAGAVDVNPSAEPMGVPARMRPAPPKDDGVPSYSSGNTQTETLLRQKEQAQYDAMLERERKGGDDGLDKW